VVRYSPSGELLEEFGAKGRGPGEFAYPGSMACTGKHHVVVCEELGEPIWASRKRILLREPGEEPMAGMYEYLLKLKS